MINIQQENENITYWIPNNLPENTEEYNNSQRIKQYYLPDGKIRTHPGWFYDNQALVCDDYLFYNEGWKLYINNYSIIQVNLSSNKKVILNSENEWIVTEKTVCPTFEVYELSEELKPNILFSQTIIRNPENEWILDKINKIAKITWIVKNLTEEEISRKEVLEWRDLRENRNKLLEESDIFVIKSYEKSTPVHEDIKIYRQQLRDLPSTIQSIKIFDGTYPSLPNPIDFYI